MFFGVQLANSLLSAVEENKGDALGSGDLL